MAHRSQGGSVLGSCRPPWAADLSTDYSVLGATTPMVPPTVSPDSGSAGNTRKSGAGVRRVQSNPDMHRGPEPGEANDQDQGLRGWVRDD